MDDQAPHSVPRVTQLLSLKVAQLHTLSLRVIQLLSLLGDQAPHSALE